MRKQSSSRKFGQEVLCCHAGVTGEIPVVTTELEGAVCARLGLQQQGDLSWIPRDRCKEPMFRRSQSRQSSSGLNEPRVCPPSSADGSSWLAKAVRAGSRGGRGLKPLCCLEEVKVRNKQGCNKYPVFLPLDHMEHAWLFMLGLHQQDN